ncbi:MAG TPA: alpha-ketoglutarate-dependent dioxygenase AlkB [Bacteroidia bacterium]|nr:alpha-ketoglutarate-dependent dioxygenase AlkB [Bacteroidia bacterium]
MHQVPRQILPFDGDVFYYGRIMPAAECEFFFRRLCIEVNWSREALRIAGKLVQPNRSVAFYGEKNYQYLYSGQIKTAMLWTPLLLDLKNRAEYICHGSYNACLLNLYPNGESGMGWHSDNEKEIEPGSSIASLSFGAERRFVLKHILSGTKVEINLEPGSLLEMKGSTQSHWLHSLPKLKGLKEARINLTFRRMIPGN